MTEADVIQPSASIASPGLGLRYIGNHCYAFSGVKNVVNVELSLLEFTSGAGYIVATLQYHYGNSDSRDAQYKFYLNDVECIRGLHGGSIQAAEMEQTWAIVIPPLSKVTITGKNVTDDSGMGLSANITGRVYGAN